MGYINYIFDEIPPIYKFIKINGRKKGWDQILDIQTYVTEDLKTQLLEHYSKLNHNSGTSSSILTISVLTNPTKEEI